jgi:hypothetical protein
MTVIEKMLTNCVLECTSNTVFGAQCLSSTKAFCHSTMLSQWFFIISILHFVTLALTKYTRVNSIFWQWVFRVFFLHIFSPPRLVILVTTLLVGIIYTVPAGHIEDLLYGLTVSAFLSGLEIKQRWALWQCQSVEGRDWRTQCRYAVGACLENWKSESSGSGPSDTMPTVGGELSAMMPSDDAWEHIPAPLHASIVT